MRINTDQHQSILQATRRSFGTDVQVWLFGSRVDDTRRGGDLDLYVETTRSFPLSTELLCKISIEESLDLNVDLVVNDQKSSKPIFQIVKSTGIQL